MEEHECSSKINDSTTSGRAQDLPAADLSASLWQEMRTIRPGSGTQAEQTGSDGSKQIDPATRACYVSRTFPGPFSPPLLPRNLSQLFEETLPCIDLDHDGFLNPLEIIRASSSELTNEQRMLKVLDLFSEELQELSDDEWGDENDGITLNDMETFERLTQEQQIAHSMRMEGSSDAQIDHSWDLFFELNDNHDSSLTYDELSTGQETGVPSTPEQRLVLKHMLQRFHDIEQLSDDELGPENDGITRDDIDAYYRQVMLSSGTTLVQAVEDALERRPHRLGETAQPSRRGAPYADPDEWD